MKYVVQISTAVTVIVEVEADDEDTARDAVLYGNALPRYPVAVTATDECPPSTQVSVANKGWEIDESWQVP